MTKCLCHGCRETTTTLLCPHCFTTISTGYVSPNNHTFIGDMRDELLMAIYIIEGLSTITADFDQMCNEQLING